MNKVRAKVFEEGKAVLIDTWWNVNINTHLFCAYLIRVLIDTWWNVNTNKLGAGVEAVEVLIDTWWNVNHSR